MGKNSFSLEIWFASTITGIAWEYFGQVKIAYIILLILIGIDTITGITSAIKYKRFCSKGLYNFVKKVIYYTICIITVRLVEIVVTSIVNTTMLSQIITSYLAITESVSILENLAVLGAPIPTNLIKVLLNNITIPGTNFHFNISINDNKRIVEIEEMIKEQVNVFSDEKLRELYEINFRMWQCIINQILSINQEDSDDRDMFYFKVLSILEITFKEREHQYEDSKVTKSYIERFNNIAQRRIDDFMQKIKKICYSDIKINEKKEEIIDSIMILLYEIIIDNYRNIKKI